MWDSARRAFDLVMFDLDGTLVATAGELCAALNDSLAASGLGAVEQPQVDRWIGQGTHALVVQALAHVLAASVDSARASSLLEPVVQAFDQAYLRRCGTASQLYPQAREVLQALRRSNVKLALVTNKDARFTQPLLVAHQLAALFDVVVSGDAVRQKKPSPEGVLSCLQRFGVARERALFVGDSSVDVATARNAGVRIWAVPYGYNMGQDIAASGPDRLIDNLGGLMDSGG